MMRIQGFTFIELVEDKLAINLWLLGFYMTFTWSRSLGHWPLTIPINHFSGTWREGGEWLGCFSIIPTVWAVVCMFEQNLNCIVYWGIFVTKLLSEQVSSKYRDTERY